jgi:hypothetical protein
MADLTDGGGDAGARQKFAEGGCHYEGVDEGVRAVESPAAPCGPESADLLRPLC